MMHKYITKVKHRINQIFTKKLISLKPNGEIRGYVLLSYLISPFLLKEGKSISNFHTNQWECFQIAKTFLNLGYGIDVINWDDQSFLPKRNYSFLIDIHNNLERITPLLKQNCIKILHITGAHWLFQNQSEYRRLLRLQQRRGITLVPRRIAPPSLGIEYADCATILGNEFTINTFNYAHKPLYSIPISTTTLYPYPKDKDYQTCRNRFLWFGSSGMVHKGLDLVLEAFAEMPDYHLTVCGPVQNEEDFEKAYYQELYQTPNIHTVGWIDVESLKFLEITKNCVGLIYPSCSEGQAGSVVNCLHAGLIPIISYESGVNAEFGFILKDCCMEEIKNAIKWLAALSTEELKQKSLQAWKYARANHTREKFTHEYEKFVVNLVGKL